LAGWRRHSPSCRGGCCRCTPSHCDNPANSQSFIFLWSREGNATPLPEPGNVMI
jgi:hypothetical protein